MEEKKNIFVYGTLKKGYWNNHLLDGAKFLGEALTDKPYRLLGNGVPYAVPEEADDGGLPVKGEVYEIDVVRHLPRLDQLEGHPNVYTRRPLFATGLSGEIEKQKVEVEMYEMDNPWSHNSPECDSSEGYYIWK